MLLLDITLAIYLYLSATPVRSPDMTCNDFHSHLFAINNRRSPSELLPFPFTSIHYQYELFSFINPWSPPLVFSSLSTTYMIILHLPRLPFITLRSLLFASTPCSSNPIFNSIHLYLLYTPNNHLSPLSACSIFLWSTPPITSISLQLPSSPPVIPSLTTATDRGEWQSMKGDQQIRVNGNYVDRIKTNEDEWKLMEDRDSNGGEQGQGNRGWWRRLSKSGWTYWQDCARFCKILFW